MYSQIELDRVVEGLKLKEKTILCPFHSEKTPSCHIYPEGRFYCYGCHEHGSVFTLYMEINSVSFPVAVQQLAEKAGVTVTGERSNMPGTPLNELKKEFSEAMRVARENFKKLPNNHPAKMEVSMRGLDWKNIDLGFNPPITRHAKQLGLTSKKGMPLFEGRLCFILSDESGQEVGLSGRKLDGIQTTLQGKYVNSPSTALFKKSSYLYGIDQSKYYIKRSSRIYIVEGAFDLAAARKLGLNNTVATLGTALTENHVKLIEQLKAIPVLLFDNDDAGLKAIKKTYKYPYIRGNGYALANTPNFKDLSDLVKQNSKIAPNIEKSIAPILESVTNRTIDSCVTIQEKEQASHELTLWLQKSGATIESIRWVKSYIDGYKLPKPRQNSYSNETRQEVSDGIDFVALWVLAKNPELADRFSKKNIPPSNIYRRDIIELLSGKTPTTKSYIQAINSPAPALLTLPGANPNKILETYFLNTTI